MVALANEEVGRHFLLASPGDRGEAAGSSFCWCPLQGGLCVFALLSLDITTSRHHGHQESTPAPISVSVWSWFSIHGVRDVGVLDSS